RELDLHLIVAFIGPLREAAEGAAAGFRALAGVFDPAKDTMEVHPREQEREGRAVIFRGFFRRTHQLLVTRNVKFGDLAVGEEEFRFRVTIVPARFAASRQHHGAGFPALSVPGAIDLDEVRFPTSHAAVAGFDLADVSVERLAGARSASVSLAPPRCRRDGSATAGA